MNSYFDALMRSTGMALGEAPKAVAHAGPGIVEVEVEHGPSAVQMQRLTATRGASEPPAPGHAAGPPPARATAPSTPVPLPDLASEPALESPPPRAVSSSADDGRSLRHRDRGQTLIRAAMRWVAADVPPPQSPDVMPAAVAPSDQAPASPSAPPGPMPSIEVPAAPLILERVAGEPETANAVPPATETQTGEPRESVIVPSRTIGKPVPAPAAPARAVPNPARDERVEVSIGTINVRVDAPAPQTVAETATPPRTACADPPARPRSALSRRALRRI